MSALVIPLSTGGGRPLGFWGIDSTSERREWPEPLQKRLKIIAGIFASTIDRAMSDRQLCEKEARLRLAAEMTGAGFWTIDLETSVIWATPKIKELFGLTPDDSVDIAKFLGIVHPEDRESMEQAIDAMTRGEETRIEYRIVPSGGSTRWVLSTGMRHVFPVDNHSLLMGVTIDTTERRASEEALRTLGARLIDAQDQERKRIARELHDGISQEIATISIGLQRLQSADGLERPERVKRIEKLIKETTALASEVQALSHELHSSSLDHLGLAGTIRGLGAEISEDQQVEIHFSERDMPKCLAPDVALALFRITQESLHNALKYNGVHDFTVQLQGTGTHVELTISDSDAGFGVSEATQGHGLGLISMRERMFALKGTLSIESQPMSGTPVRVRVPLGVAVSATSVRVPVIAANFCGLRLRHTIG